MEFEYFLAFTTGLLGGFGHCIGMCGPLAAAYALSNSAIGNQYSILQRILPHLLYNTGRITTYVSIGGLMGLAGSFVNVAGRLAGIQNGVAVLTGVLMVFMGLRITGIMGGMDFIEKHNNLIIKAVKEVMQSESFIRYYLFGMLSGLLPCGLSYTLFIAAAGTGNILSGMATTFLFGIGTIPALLLFGIVVTYLSYTIRGIIYKAGGGVVILMGIYFIYRSIVFYAKM